MRISSHEHNVSIPSTSPLKKVGQELTKVSGSVVPKLTCRREQYHRIRYGRVYGLILLPGLIWNNREFRDSSPESRDRTEIMADLIFIPVFVSIAMGSIREFRDSSPESRDRTEITGRSDIHSGLHLNRNGKHQGIQGISPLTPRDTSGWIISTQHPSHRPGGLHPGHKGALPIKVRHAGDTQPSAPTLRGQV